MVASYLVLDQHVKAQSLFLARWKITSVNIKAEFEIPVVSHSEYTFMTQSHYKEKDKEEDALQVLDASRPSANDKKARERL
ncbi:hypothetical protein AG0111_0g7768 [Alternaria gaisen]|uniref:Uncharacterized protein n=1 Tax=Alternaria gaisen TaxID=167740 RepID=A0ACB6FIX2_9PLEO|nr:hypothetical protein AG0111_0g7768 [Alternaria gaisen]